MELPEKIQGMMTYIDNSLQDFPDAPILIDDTFACEVIHAGQSVFAKESNVFDLSGDFAVVGDIHGNLSTLLRIFNRLGWPPARRYLFLGDYVDRGQYSCEVILILYGLKALFPDQIFLLRGNHEFAPMPEVYGFQEEAHEKFPPIFYSTVIQSFDDLPMAVVLNGEAFCVHGGLSPEFESVDKIRNLPKPNQWRTDAEDSINDFFWGDPTEEIDDFTPSKRGCGYYYGSSVTEQFLRHSGLQVVIRAHENCTEGFRWSFDSHQALTVFSTCDYCGTGNTAAVALCTRGNPIEFISFPPEAQPAAVIPSGGSQESDEDEETLVPNASWMDAEIARQQLVYA
jgi:protein phosphatase